MSIKAIDENGIELKCGEHDNIVNEIKVYFFNKAGNIPALSRAFCKRIMTTFDPLNDDCPTEDELISFRALLLGKNALLPQIGVYYRKHKNSSSSPEFFDKYPLEKILKQQNDDMLKAVDFRLITEEDRKREYAKLEQAMYIRKRYRKYYAEPSIKNLVALINHNDLDFRSKLHYIKSHFVH